MRWAVSVRGDVDAAAFGDQTRIDGHALPEGQRQRNTRSSGAEPSDHYENPERVLRNHAKRNARDLQTRVLLLVLCERAAAAGLDARIWAIPIVHHGPMGLAPGDPFVARLSHKRTGSPGFCAFATRGPFSTVLNRPGFGGGSGVLFLGRDLVGLAAA